MRGINTEHFNPICTITMAYNRTPTDDDKSIVEFQTEISVIGNAAVNDSLLQLTSHTDGLYSVDLLEIAITTTGESALESSLPTLRWNNAEQSNDSGTYSRSLTLSSNAAGIYFMEYNLPVNLYKFNGRKHRFGSQRFELLLFKFNGTRLNTSLVRMRLRVRYFAGESMQYDPQFKHTILNAPT